MKKRGKAIALLFVILISFLVLNLAFAQETPKLDLNQILEDNPNVEEITVKAEDVGMDPGEYVNEQGVRLSVVGGPKDFQEEQEEAVVLTGEILEFNYVFEEPTIEKVEIGNNTYDKVLLEDTDSFEKTGEPVLPVKTVKILLPQDAELSGVNVVGEDETEIPGSYFVEPAQEQYPLLLGIEKNITPPKKSVYSSNEPYIKSIKSKEGTGELAGYKVVYLNIYPVNYVPNQGKLSYYQNIKVQLGYSEPGFLERTRDSLFGEVDDFRDLKEDKERVEKLVDNPQQAEEYKEKPMPLFERSKRAITGYVIVNSSSPIDYVIITNEEFKNYDRKNSLFDLIEKKNQKGLTTAIVTVEDIYSDYAGRDNAEKIRNFIKDAYLNWETQYVLLVGDADGADVGGESGDDIVPIRKLWVQKYDSNWEFIPSDVYYSNLDGDFDYDQDSIFGEPGDGEGGGEVDLIADVYVGRAPVDSITELSNFVKKTLDYEAAMENDDVYLNEMLMVGEYLGFGGISDYAKSSMEEIRLGSSNYGYTTVGFDESGLYNINTLYDQDGTWSRTELINKINDNLFAMNHLGHANVNYVMKMDNLDADDLNNNKPFFLYSQGCLPGSLDNYYSSYKSYDSIAEHFIGEKNGAFAAILNARYGWGRGYSTDGASQRHNRRFVHAITEEQITTLGKANAYAKEGLIGYISSESCYSYSSCLMRGIYWETNLFGDPEVSFNTPPPKEHNLKAKNIVVPARVYADSVAEVKVDIINSGLNDESGILVDFYVNNEIYETKTIQSLGSGASTEVVFDWNPGVGGGYDIMIYVNPVLGEDFLIDNEQLTSKEVVSTEISYPYVFNLDLTESEIINSKKQLEIKGTATGKNFQGYTISLCDSGFDYCGSEGVTLVNEGLGQIKEGTLGYINFPENTDSDKYYIKLANNYNGLEETEYRMIHVETMFQEGDWPKEIPGASAGGDWVWAFMDQPTVADINNDGREELIIAYERLMAFYSNGSYVPGFPVKPRGYVIQYGPAVADLDGDGRKEIVYKDTPYTQIITDEGKAYPGWPKQIETSGTVNLADVNSDGKMELIFRKWYDRIDVMDLQGNSLPGWPQDFQVPEGFDYFQSIGRISVADLDNDGDVEIVVIATGCNRSSYCLSTEFVSNLVVYNHQGNVLFSKEYLYSGMYPPTFLADLDNDGNLDILHSSDKALHAVDIYGNELPGFPLRMQDDIWLTLQTIGDFEDNGKVDLVVRKHDYNGIYGDCTHIYEYDSGQLILKNDPPTCRGDTINGLTRYFYAGDCIGGLSGDSEQLVALGHSGVRDSPNDLDIFFINPDGSMPVESPRKRTDGYTDASAIGDLDGDGDNELIYVGTWGHDLFVWDLNGAGDNDWTMYGHDPRHTGTFSKFTNAPGLYLINGVLKDITPYSFSVDLETSNPTNVTINVIHDDEVVRTVTHNTQSENHSILVDGLEPETKYSYNIRLTDNYRQFLVINGEEEFYTRTTSKIPALPTSLYGRVETTDGELVEDVEVTAGWIDVDDNFYETKTRTLTQQQAAELGDENLKGYFRFNNGEIKAKEGSLIKVSVPNDLNDPDLSILASPGGRAVEIKEPILLSGAIPEITISVPEEKEYLSTETPIYLNYSVSKPLKQAYYALNGGSSVNILGEEGQEIQISPKTGMNSLNVSVVDVVGLRNSRTITFSVRDVEKPEVILENPVYSQDSITLSATVSDSLSDLSSCEVCISKNSCTEWVSATNQFYGLTGKCTYVVKKSDYVDGDYKFNFRVSESSGNSEIGSEGSITVDNISPREIAGLGAEMVIGENALNVTWQASGDKDFKEYRVYRSSSPEQLVKVITDRQETSFKDINLESEGNYTYRVSVVDDYYNENSGVEVTATVADTIVPFVEVYFPEHLRTYDKKNLSLDYYVSEDSVCTYNINGAVYPADETVRALEGQNVLFVSCDDGFNAGNSSAIIFYVDTLPPQQVSFINLSQKKGQLEVDLSWNPVWDSKNYLVYRYNNPFSNVANLTPIYSTSNTEYSDSGLVSEETYYYAVATQDSAGNINTFVNSFPITLNEVTPPEITIISPTSTTYGSSSVILNYSVNEPVSSCSYYLDSDVSTSASSGMRISVDEGRHSIRVLCNDLANNPGYSSIVSFDSDLGAPNPISQLTVQGVSGSTSLKLDWAQSEATDFKHYNIYRSTSSFKNVEGMTPITTSTSLTYTDNNVDSGVTYYYAVTAVDIYDNENKQVTSVSETSYDDTPLIINLVNPVYNANYNKDELAVVFTTNRDYDSCTYYLSNETSPGTPGEDSDNVSFTGYFITGFATAISGLFKAMTGLSIHQGSIDSGDTISVFEGLNTLSVTCTYNGDQSSTSNAVRFSVDTIAPEKIRITNLSQGPEDMGVDLSWEPYTGEDFLNYNIYRSTSNFSSVEGMTPLARITTSGITFTFHLEGGYYYAVTAVDQSLNEDKEVTTEFIEVIPVDVITPKVNVDSVASEVYGKIRLQADVSDNVGLAESCVVCIASDGFCDTEWVSATNEFVEGSLSGKCSYEWDTELFEKTNYIYTFNVTDLNGNNGVGTTRSTTVVERPPLTCSDGTVYGDCSSTNPKYCDNGTIIDNCGLCGCDQGVCQEDGGCVIPTCSDGTEYGQCSSTKPKYCDNGTLVDKCTLCGCSQGTCSVINDTCSLDSPENLTCSDGTLYSQCSFQKPLYCSDGALIDNCGLCGCPPNNECNVSGTCYLIPEPTITVELYPGWNIFSVPYGLEDYSILNVLSDVDGKYDSVYSYDSGTGNWLSYIPNKTVFDGSDSLFSLEPGKGYWIDMRERSSLTLEVQEINFNKGLNQGWNLVGYPNPESVETSIGLSSLSNKYDMIYGYDNNLKVWKIYSPYPSPLFNNTLTQLEPGKGYWIYVYENSNWNI